MRLSLFIGGSTSGRSGDGPPVGSLQRSRRSLIRLVDILIALLVLSSLPAAAAGPEAFRPETVLAAGRAHGLSDALASRYSGEAMDSSRDASDGPGRRRPATSGRPNLTLTVRDARATRMALFAANYNSWNFNYGDADRVTTSAEFVATKTETARALGPAVPIGIVLGGLANGKSKGVKVVGGEDELDEVFDRLTLGGVSVPRPGYKGVVIQLPDGTQVGKRGGSKSGGATIDIKLPDGSEKKVHIEP